MRQTPVWSNGGVAIVSESSSHPSFSPVNQSAAKAARASRLGKISKTNQDRYTERHISGRVTPFSQPGNVTLDPFANPRSADSVHSSRADEITIEHNNLLSEIQSKEIIARIGAVMWPRRKVDPLKSYGIRTARHITRAATLHGPSLSGQLRISPPEPIIVARG